MIHLVFMVAAPLAPEFSLAQLLPLLLVIPLLIFWAWMFRDMIRNANLPDSAKNAWTIAFLFLNVFAAVYYYATEYRNRR